MYKYSEFDHAFITERNRQFRAQVERRIDGSLTCMVALYCWMVYTDGWFALLVGLH